MTYRKAGCGTCNSILEDVKRYERINRNKAKPRARSYSSYHSSSSSKPYLSSPSPTLVSTLIALGASFTIATILMKKQGDEYLTEPLEVDDSYLSPIEIEDVKASQEEIARGEGKLFMNIDDLLKWLHQSDAEVTAP